MSPKSLAAVALLVAAPAAAFSEGQFGFSGKENSCLACHGSNSYAGITVASDAAEKTLCVQGTGQEAVRYEIPVVRYGQSTKLTLTIAKPDEGAVGCPEEDCDVAACSEASGVCRKAYDKNEICPQTLNECGTPLGGFNAAIDGAGTWESVDDSTRVLTEGGVMDPETGETDPVEPSTEITHRLARQLGDGPAIWTFTYKAPATAAEATGEAAAIYIGANVANGNGWADDADLNTNITYGVALVDDATQTAILPPYCGACAGNKIPDAEGKCPACACTAIPTSSGAAGALVLGVLVLATRRRSTSPRR